MPSARIWFCSLGPSAPAIAMASSTLGNANNTSMLRMIIVSMNPPAYAAVEPSARLTSVAAAVGTTPETSEIRPPHISRARTSRCWPSMPRRCPGVSGGAKRGPSTVAVGSYGEMNGIVMLTSTIAAINRRPARAGRSAITARPMRFHWDGCLRPSLIDRMSRAGVIVVDVLSRPPRAIGARPLW